MKNERQNFTTERQNVDASGLRKCYDKFTLSQQVAPVRLLTHQIRVSLHFNNCHSNTGVNSPSFSKVIVANKHQRYWNSYESVLK